MSSPLHAVPQFDDQAVPDHDDVHYAEDDAAPAASAEPAAEIPQFEGQHVATTKGKITSVSGLEVGDEVFRLDQTVRLVVECQVVGIDHKVAANGKLERVHLLKAVDSVVVDWELSLDTLREELG